MTHPFHPLHGREFEMLEYRQTWGENRVYFLDLSGQLKRLPASWTDVVGEDPFVTVATGRSPLRLEDLLQLVDLLDRLRVSEEM
ncbi:MAG TPA: DUF5372 family protein [Desulfatiglandales bacterium]